MKLAPIVAGGTLALVLVVLSTAKAVSPPHKRQALDMAGIDTLEIHTSGQSIVGINADQPAFLFYEDSVEAKVSLRRSGRVLVVNADIGEYAPLRISVPPSVHRFILTEGAINAHVPMQGVEVQARSVTWTGGVRRLVLHGSALPKPKAGECNCKSNAFSVDKGKVGELRAYSTNGRLTLEDPDEVGVVYAWLGAEGTVSVTNARGFDHIYLLKDGAEAPRISAGAR